jgi:hypothetical protein
MAHIDHSADKPWFFASFFSGATKTGRFEAVLVSLGCVALAVGVFLAGHMPAAMELAAP